MECSKGFIRSIWLPYIGHLQEFDSLTCIPGGASNSQPALLIAWDGVGLLTLLLALSRMIV